MKYMLQFFESASDFAKRNDPQQSQAYWGARTACVDALIASGIMVSGEGLQPPETTTVVQIRDGKRLIHDGPYAESKEMIAGFFVIEVPELDTALEWAARSPCAAYARTEVRPVMPPPPAP
jgi:hypothetical protein